jgi:hypothetical protein
MSVYFEGNGKSRPVTFSECRDQFVATLKEMRTEILTDPALEAYEDTAQRDLYIANRTITGMLEIVEGNNPSFPALNLVPISSDEDKAEAHAAGANYIDLTEFADISGGLAEYWTQVNS